jgi:hypothetical protein
MKEGTHVDSWRAHQNQGHVFFNSEVMRASFISWGNTPEERDKLIIFAIEGANEGRHFFRTNVGNGTRGEEFDAHDNMRDEIS